MGICQFRGLLVITTSSGKTYWWDGETLRQVGDSLLQSRHRKIDDGRWVFAVVCGAVTIAELAGLHQRVHLFRDLPRGDEMQQRQLSGAAEPSIGCDTLP